MKTTALVPLSLSPVDCVIRNFNAAARASAGPNDLLFLHVEESVHWIRMGIFQGAEYFDMLFWEDEKERRKAWYAEAWEEDGIYEPSDFEEDDPMADWFI